MSADLKNLDKSLQGNSCKRKVLRKHSFQEFLQNVKRERIEDQYIKNEPDRDFGMITSKKDLREELYPKKVRRSTAQRRILHAIFHACILAWIGFFTWQFANAWEVRCIKKQH